MNVLLDKDALIFETDHGTVFVHLDSNHCYAISQEETGYGLVPVEAVIKARQIEDKRLEWLLFYNMNRPEIWDE